MPAGLQVLDEHGNIVLNLADRVARVVGSFACPGAPQSGARSYTYQIPAHVVSQGAPFIWHSHNVFPVEYYYANASLNLTVNASGVISVYLYSERDAILPFDIFYGVR